MMQKIPVAVIMSVVTLVIVSSGCVDLDFLENGTTTYQLHPTKIQYDVSYGYNVTCSGTGPYEIRYLCDKPEVIQGSVSSLSLLHTMDYILMDDERVIFWNISGHDAAEYTLGVSASVFAESFLVADLNGNGALTVEDIALLHPDLVQQYCHKQGVGENVYIDPGHSDIQATATMIRNQTNSSNAFMLAQALFVWLKENTMYYLHNHKPHVQTAATTYQLRTGDCDDLSFLYISLCRSQGIPARFIRGYLIDEIDGMVTAGAHAWVEVFVGGTDGNQGWIPVECACSASVNAEVHQNFGVEDVYHLRLFVSDGSNESLNTSLSGISWTYNSFLEVHAEPFIVIDNYMVLEEHRLVISENNIRSYETAR